MVACQENCQAICQFPVVQPFIEILFFRNQFCHQHNNGQYSKCNYKRPQYVIT